MSEQETVENSAFNPNHLLDTIVERMMLKNDPALSRFLQVTPPVVSKIRRARTPVGASLLLRIRKKII